MSQEQAFNRDKGKGGKRKNMREKGHRIERLYARLFRESGLIGFDRCQTARSASKLLDDSKVDLIFIPLNVQIKAGRQMGLKPSEILRQMKELVTDSFPEHYPEHNNPNILIHHKDVDPGAQRTPYDAIVSMTFETFYDLLQKLHNKGKVPDIMVLGNNGEKFVLVDDTENHVEDGSNKGANVPPDQAERTSGVQP